MWKGGINVNDLTDIMEERMVMDNIIPIDKTQNKKNKAK